MTRKDSPADAALPFGEPALPLMNTDISILREQGAVLVLNKPGGLLTQAPPGIDSLEWRVKQFLKVRDAKPGKVYLGVPHRLDRPVSGAIVLVKNVRAAQRISAQLQRREVEKTYWAIVEGQVEPETGYWEDWMRKVPGEARSEIVGADVEGAKHARLAYRRLDCWQEAGTGPWRSLLEIELETGRTHQIRLQAGSRGWPIVGDELYGSQVPFGPPLPDQRQRWIALHARRLAFRHPMIEAQVDELAPLPVHWRPFAESAVIAAAGCQAEPAED